MKRPPIPAATLLLTLIASPALAHSFNALLVVPADASVAEDMRIAFVLAANERDGHPGNDSAGHLGGVDVYLEVSISGPPAGFAPHIVVNPLSSESAGAQAGAFHIADSDLQALDARESLGEAADPGLPPFAIRFRDETGRNPGPEAEASYLAGRLIDRLVRPLDSAQDTAALAETMKGLR